MVTGVSYWRPAMFTRLYKDERVTFPENSSENFSLYPH